MSIGSAWDQDSWISSSWEPTAWATAPVSSDLTLQWHVNNDVQQDTILQWDITTRVRQDVILQWDIKSFVSSDIELQWTVIEELTLGDLAGKLEINSLTPVITVQKFRG